MSKKNKETKTGLFSRSIDEPGPEPETETETEKTTSESNEVLENQGTNELTPEESNESETINKINRFTKKFNSRKMIKDVKVLRGGSFSALISILITWLPIIAKEIDSINKRIKKKK